MAYVSYHPIGAPMAMGDAGTTSYGYDGVQRPASLAHAFSGGAGSVAWTYGRNPAGQLNTITRDNDAFAWTRHYGVQRPYTTNGRNQYSAAGPTTLTYDDNGNLISETTANVTRTYTYDIENRLVGASVPGGAQVQLGYDPLGRLSWTTGSPNFTRFLYDGDALVAEYDYAGTLMTQRYAHWVGADVPLVSYEGASLANAAGRWLFADHQGSIVAAAYPNESTAWVNTYDEYGIPGAGNSGRFQYTGQIWLQELGMYHYKARVYSPTLGRFLQTDPVGYDDQFNLYAYVGNDPVNRADPTGTTCEERRNGTFCRVNQFYLLGIVSIPRENLTAFYRNQVRKFETNYTRAYIAMRDQDRTVTVGATGGRANTSFQVSTRDVAASLAGRQAVYNMGLDSGNTLLDTGGNPNRVAHSGLNMQIYERGINATVRNIIHDGIHSTRAEYDGNYLAPVLGYEPYATEHQDPYNVAADRLCGRLC